MDPQLHYLNNIDRNTKQGQRTLQQTAENVQIFHTISHLFNLSTLYTISHYTHSHTCSVSPHCTILSHICTLSHTVSPHCTTYILSHTVPHCTTLSHTISHCTTYILYAVVRESQTCFMAAVINIPVKDFKYSFLSVKHKSKLIKKK